MSSNSRYETTPFCLRPEERRSIGSHTVAYRAIGQGPDLVFVHGWPLHTATFRFLLPTLAQHYTCHLFDLPNAGASPAAQMKEGYRDRAKVVTELVDSLGLRSYGLVAHDSGGAIARLAAVEHGTRVRALVLGNTEIPNYHPPAVDRFLKLAKLPGAVPMFRLLLRSRTFRHSPWILGGAFADKSRLDGEFHDLFIQPLIDDPARLRAQMEFLHHYDAHNLDSLAEGHGRIAGPALLLWGPGDPFFPLKRARAMVDQFGAGAELRELPGGRLLAHEEYADAFLEHAVPFLHKHLGNQSQAIHAH